MCVGAMCEMWLNVVVLLPLNVVSVARVSMIGNYGLT